MQNSIEKAFILPIYCHSFFIVCPPPLKTSRIVYDAYTSEHTYFEADRLLHVSQGN